MKRTLTTRINIPTEKFLNDLKEKIRGFRGDSLGLEPFQWNNIRIHDNKLIIEKSMKPLGKCSGKIESEIIYGNEITILKTTILPDTIWEFQTFLKYFIGIGIGFSALLYLLLDFNFYVLLGLLIFEVLIFAVEPIRQEENIDELVRYYNNIISEISTK